jgi:hypothetical protein
MSGDSSKSRSFYVKKERNVDEEVRRRFLDKVDKTDSCWNWTASTRMGYGAFSINRKIYSAHRVSFEMAKGHISGFILHKCNNRLCVNPDHLYQGTQKDNVRDSIAAGTHYLISSRRGYVFPPGEKHPSCKLSKENVISIRELYKSGIGYRKLGKLYGVDSTNIRLIIKGRTWASV